ncbi:MAG: transporter related protein [Acidimicrobiales bacterium]|nr:transporter related protein [Acidimicrobiales bacterium]
MTELLRFALLGLGTGAMYALAALGIVLIYRGSGVVNFGQGAMGIAAAYVYYECHVVHGWPIAVAFLLGLLFSAGLGVLTQVLVMRPLRNASSLVRLVATLGVMLTLQAAALLRYGSTSRFVASALPDKVVKITPHLTISRDRLYLLAIAAVLTLVLSVVYRRTNFGRATSAVAENQRAASSLGWSPNLIATVNWGVGAALGGVAAMLIVPIVSLQVGILTSVTVYALAVALVAGLSSFGITLAAGLVLGVLQAWTIRYASSTVGLSDALPFVIIMIVLVVRGRGLPLRGSLLDRLPSVSSGRIRPVPLLVAAVLATAAILSVDPSWVNAITASLVMAIVLLSVVVLTGYAGQLSLGQFALAGAGAYICGRLDAAAGLPLPLAFVIAIACAVPIGIVFGLPALRTRGVNLAILTLGLGTAIGSVVFTNISLTGSSGFDSLKAVSIFGLDLSAVTHPERYALLVLGWFVLLALGVANLRRSRVGRRLVAIRTNERAAAALGISVLEGKLYAFVLSTAIASIGGILLAYESTSVTYSTFSNPFESINAVALAVIGGIGYLTGPLWGALLATGGLGGKIGESVFSANVVRYLPLFAGLVFIVMLLQDPDGLAEAHVKMLRRLGRLGARGKPLIDRAGRTLKRDRSHPSATPAAPALSAVARPAVQPFTRVPPTDLSVTGLTVRFGGLLAVNEVSFEVSTGRVTGLIGANGAGKTTVIDALTGFTKPSAGRITLNGVALERQSATRRARQGISRSFQSLELFDDMTVEENLLTAAEPRDRASYLSALLGIGRRGLPDDVRAVVEEFELTGDLDRQVKDLPYAQRRLVAIARAVATRPSILMLDEPAAGLSDAESTELAHVVRRLVEQSGIGVLLIEHDMQFVMGLCDDVVVLDFGRVIAHGPPDAVRAHPAVLAAYLGEADEPESDAADRVHPAEVTL